MQIIRIKDKKIMLVIHPDTFAILEPRDSKFARTWRAWLKEGIQSIGLPPNELTEGLLEDIEVTYFPSPTTLGLLSVDLLREGLKLEE